MLFRRISIIAISLFIVGVLLSSMSTAAVSDIEPGNQEVIAEVERKTGLTFDVLDKLMKESPALFGNIKDTITAVKLADMLFSAQDSEALAELFNREVGAYMDKFIGNALPGSMLSFIGAVKLYKDSLEAVRDYVFIPSMEAAIYEHFKRARGGVADHRYASPDEAFDQATASGKYFPAKKKMFDELVKAKGYNPKLIGKKLEDDLWKQIDSFWVTRLETQYQKEVIVKQREDIIREAWAKREADLKAIKSAAGKSKDIENFFVKVPDELPDGWWFCQKGSWTSALPKRKGETSKVWQQFFFMSRDSGFVRQGDKNIYWKDPKNPGRKISTVSLDIRIRPANEASEKRSIQYSVEKSGFSYMGESKMAVIKTENRDNYRKIYIRFYRKGFAVIMDMAGDSSANSSPSEAMAKHFARLVASRIH